MVKGVPEVIMVAFEPKLRDLVYKSKRQRVAKSTGLIPAKINRKNDWVVESIVVHLTNTRQKQ